MAFQCATQTTNLESADQINAVRYAALSFRERYPDAETMSEPHVIALAQHGDEDAMYELITRHEARIRKLVHRHLVDAAPKPDLQQAALLGFVEAVRDYKPGRGVGLFTFAHFRITKMLQSANAAYDSRGIARNAHQRYWFAMEKADGDAVTARHWAGLECLSAADLEPLADAGDMIAREIVDARLDRWERLVSRDPDNAPEWDTYAAEPGRGLGGPAFDAIHAAVSYLDAPSETDDGDAGDAHDTTADPEAGDPYADAENRAAFAQVLGTLDDREQKIITSHLDGMTDRAIADALGLSRPRVVNIRAAAVRKMRKLAAAS